MRRSGAMRPVIRSYKKILNFAGASRAGSTDHFKTLTLGTDGLAAGQTGVTDVGVPTGCILKYIEIQYCVTNLVATTLFVNGHISQMHSGQTVPSPLTVGGNPLRNQVHYQFLFSVGKDQNSTHIFRFKIPKRFQRVREGDQWFFTVNANNVFTDIAQVIYKFYQ